tara:strand:+ start:1477 stop:1941 length:465 start_codon:yes stop_codon:yes gene_type:complete
MKTSKIKTVVSIKPHKNSYGETFYHNLEMENGDKINIGKKKEQQVGWELTYEITEQGQQEYNKAKAVAPESFNKSNNYTPSNSSNDDRQLLIVKQSSIKAAVEFDNQCTIEDMLKNAEIIKDWVMGTDVQKKVDKVSKAFNDKFAGTTPDDLPF